ncbi:hypothetical protein BGZ83_001895 [Gryganskiella cystojenkinii]|nr:hypothetical protein BGZ83_001895 [Gryganskiella cystojenkinii]
MISAETLDKINLALQKVMASNEPFGGLAVALFGDFGQLGPIVRQNVNGTEPAAEVDRDAWMDRARVYNSLARVSLRQACRQGYQSEFFKFLSIIRTGSESEDQEYVKRVLHDRNMDRFRSIPAESVVLCSTRLFSRDISNSYKDEVADEEKFEIQSVDNIETAAYDGQDILERETVIVTANLAFDQGVVNETIGHVVRVTETDQLEIRLKDGSRYLVNKIVREQSGGGHSRCQFPLMLAYALTIHRAQGLTLDSVVVNLKSASAQLGGRSTRSSPTSLVAPLTANPRKKIRTDSPTSPLSSSTVPTLKTPLPQPVSRPSRSIRPGTPAERTRRHTAVVSDEEDFHSVEEISNNEESNDGDTSANESSDSANSRDDYQLAEPEGSRQASKPNSPRTVPTNDEVFAQMDEEDQFGVQNADWGGSSTDGDDDEDLDTPPEFTKIILNFRKGQPPCTSTDQQDEDLKNLRKIKDLPAVEIVHNRGDEFDFFLGRIKGNIALLRKKSEKNKALQWWDTETPYIQPSHSKRQAEFAPLTPDDFEIKIAHAYHAEVARERLEKGQNP